MPGRRAPRAPILWFVACCALPPANARAAVAASAPPWPVVADEAADEAAAFVVGLAAKDLHELVLKEGRAFLAAHAAHTEATLVRHLVAEAAYALARYDEARADFERVVAVPGFAQVREARFRLGQCALELGDARAAAAAFEEWNRALVPLLVDSQRSDGAWEPLSSYATEYALDDPRDAAYSTAMAVLCLEVYYRYFTPLLTVAPRVPRDDGAGAAAGPPAGASSGASEAR